MLLHVQDNIQISCRAAELPYFPRTREANARSILHTWRDFRVDGPLTQDAALTLAFRAGVGNDIARSLTRRTRARDAEETLLVTNLPAAIA